MKKIMIDIGHGGSDNGAEGYGLKEKEVNLIVGIHLRSFLWDYDCEVRITREHDKYLSADERVRIVNEYNPDLCVSVHHNSAVISARGAEVIHAHYDEEDNDLANMILTELEKVGMPKRREFTKLNTEGHDWYYMIRRIWDNDTDAIITEGGFISNPEDANMLSDLGFLYKEAECIGRSIVVYLGLQLKKTGDVNMAQTIRRGSKGESVLTMQRLLSNKGYALMQDGIFGKETEAIVMQFQAANNLISDGIVGPMTWSMISMSRTPTYAISRPTPFITVVKIKKDALDYIDVINSVGAFETMKSMHKRLVKKPDFMINGGLFGMVNGVSLSKFQDDGVKVTDGIYTNFCLITTYDNKVKFDYVETSAVEKVVKDILSGSPSLVVNGKIQIDARGLDYSFIHSKHPRTAIGETEDHIVLLVVDGRRPWARGMTIQELAQYMHSLKCVNVINVDGGGSSLMLGENGLPLSKPLYARGIDNAIAVYIKKQG